MRSVALAQKPLLRPLRARRPEILALAMAGLSVLAATTAQADPPALAPEQFLTGDAATVTAPDVQEFARIAPGGPGYLVVWEDRRSVLSGFVNTDQPLNGNGIDIYAMRLDAAGDPIDASPVLVTQQGHNQEKPQVAWNEAAQAWLVVWTTQRPDWYFFEDIVCARVSASGELLDPAPIPLRLENNSPANDYAQYPTVASDGNQWVVAWVDILWQGQNGRPNVAAKRVNAAGTVLDPNPVVLYQHPDNVFGPIVPHLAWATDEYLLVWERAGFYDVIGMRMNAALQTIGPSSFIITEFGYGPRVASNGTDFLVSTRYNRVHRVTHAGVSLDPSGIPLNTPEGSDYRGPDVAWNGQNWCVVHSGWQALHNKIWLARVSASGAVLGTSVVQDTGHEQFNASIASRGNGTAAVVWGERHANVEYLENVRGSLVQANGSASPVRDVSVGLRRQSYVRFARNGSEILAVYVSQGGGTTRIVAQRMDGNGNAIDAEPTVVHTTPETSRSIPAVTWNGTYYLVVWAANNSVYGRRLDATADPVDANPVLLLTDNASSPAIGALGSSILLSYVYTFSGDQNYLKGVRVDASTMSLAGSPVQIGPGFVIPGVRIEPFAGRWFVVYEDQGNHDVTASVITGVFVAADGTPAPSFQISTSFNDDQPGLAVAGNSALVTWVNVQGYGTPAVEARLVNEDGSFGTSPFLVADAPGRQLFTSAAWDGQQFVAAWADFRSVTGVEQLRGDIFAARIDAGGFVLDPGGFQVTEGELPEDLPFVTGGGGRAIIAYCRMHGPGGPEVQRIGYRILGFDPAGVEPAGDGASAWNVGPVPFRDRLTIEGRTDAQARVDVYAFDGRRVVSAEIPAGSPRFVWNGRTQDGSPAAAGAYFVRIVEGGRVVTQRRVIRID